MPLAVLFLPFFRSGKLQNKSFPNFSNFRPEFCPEFCSEFSLNFSGTFHASFRGRRRPEKIHQKSPPFFNAKFPGKHGKSIHKILLESRQSNLFGFPCILLTMNLLVSGKKKERKTKLFDPDMFGWGGGLPRERVGAKSSVSPSKPMDTKLFGGISWDFARKSQGARQV